MEGRSGPTRRDVLRGAAAMGIGLAFGAVDVPASAADPPAAGALEKRGWTLTMHDEFDGPALDSSIWIPRYLGFRMPPDVGNAQYRLENGSIVLSVTADTPPFGSAFSRPREQVSSIQTAQGDYNQGSFVLDHEEPPVVKFAQQYGYFEIRAKGQRDDSGHSAFWLNTADPAIFARGNRPGSPNALEVDVFEAGRGDAYATTVLTPGTPFTITSGTYPFDIADDFHVYGIEWTPTAVNIFVDGQLIHVHDGRRVVAAPMFVYLSLYTNSQFGNGSPPLYPSEFSIDYIRVYRRDPNLALAGSASGTGIANPEAAIDGRPGTAATGRTGAADHDLTVTFGVGQNLSRVAIEAELPAAYEIQVSPDGGAGWTTVATSRAAVRAGRQWVLDFARQTNVQGVRLLIPGDDRPARRFRIAELAFADTHFVDQAFDDETTGAAPLGWRQDRVGGTIAIEELPSAADKSMAISRTATSSTTAVAEKRWPAIRGRVAVTTRVESDAAGTSARLPAVIGADGGEIAAIVLDQAGVTAVAGAVSRLLSPDLPPAGSWHDVELVVDAHRRAVIARFDDRTEVLPLHGDVESAGVRFSLATPGARVHVGEVVVRWLDALLEPGREPAGGR